VKPAADFKNSEHAGEHRGHFAKGDQQVHGDSRLDRRRAGGRVPLPALGATV